MEMDEFDVGAYQLNWEGIANEKNNLAEIGRAHV